MREGRGEMRVLHSLSGNINYLNHFMWQLMLLNNPAINFSLAALQKLMYLTCNCHPLCTPNGFIKQRAFENKGNFIFQQLSIKILLWNAGWKAWEAKEEERGWLRMGGCRDLPRWAVSRCCAVSTDTFPWDSLHEGLGGKCCQLHLGAEKLSRAGLVKLTLIASISLV